MASLEIQTFAILSGTAGTGKSYTLNGLFRKMREKIFFVAPTGKAADNLPFKCETIHSGFLISTSSSIDSFEVTERK